MAQPGCRFAPLLRLLIALMIMILGHAEADEPLFIPAAPQSQVLRQARDLASGEGSLLRLNPAAWRTGAGGMRRVGSRLALPLPATPVESFTVESLEVRNDSAFTCVGSMSGRPGRHVWLAVVNDAVAGTIHLPGRPVLQVEHVGGGLHRLIPAGSPGPDWCAPPPAPRPQSSADPGEPGSVDGPKRLPNRADREREPARALANADGDDAPILDFLVLYTKRALDGAGGDAGMEALLDYAVLENNLCYANSGIRARWNIAGREQTAYNESGSIASDLVWLMNNAGVAALKSAYHADIVMLVSEYDRYGYAGIASPNAAGHGYTVFLRPWIASGQYVVPHEVGHLLGAGHDRFTCAQRYARAGCGAYYNAFSYGHRFELDGVQYRTVMAYEPGLSVPYFSNPSILFRGQVPTGVAAGATNAADNVRTINERAVVVSQALDPNGRIGFETNIVVVAETAGSVTLAVRRTGDLTTQVSVAVATVADRASPGEDFLAVAQRLVFPVGVAVTNIAIPILRGPEGTLGVEGDEQFFVSLREPGGGAGLDRLTQVRVIIRDADPWFRVRTPRLTVPESAAAALVEVERGGDLSTDASVPFAVRPGTAEEGVDYSTVAGTVSFLPGASLATIAVPLIPDTLAEGDESFTVELDAPNFGGLVPGEQRTTVTILDDDREGSLDPGWDVTEPLRPPTSLGALLVQPDGRVLVTGAPAWRDSPALILRRLLEDGTVDPSFNEVEFLPAPSPDPGAIAPVVLAFTLLPDGRILVTGEFASVHGQLRPHLVRLQADGSLDESFAAWPDSPCYAACVQPDGRMLVGGSFQHLNGADRAYLARLEPDGTLDPTFAPQANADTLRVRGLALQPDGKVLVWGTFWGFEGLNRPYLARLNANGTLDRLFAGRPDGIVNALALLPDGRMLMAGGFTAPRLGLARLLADGQTDLAFDPGNLFNAPVRHVLPLADGRSLVAGGFTDAGSARQRYVVRLQTNGSPDLSFDTGLGPDDAVAQVALQPDGAVLINGFFGRVNGIESPNLARLRGADLRLRFDPPVFMAEDDALRLRLHGPAGTPFAVEASTSLRDWSVIRTGILTASPAEWDEPLADGAQGGSARFFRARAIR